uniref:Uncharacterized protein n=1 Tax=Caenorhabditis japonica TaxID=281687 RepID=A0A8R1EC73_CAEJA
MTKKRSGGARKYLLERLKELAGDGGRELWTTILNASELARAGNTVKAYENANKRKLRGLHDTGLPDGEPSLLLYLAHINKTVGSSSMSQVIAAFQIFRQKSQERPESKRKENIRGVPARIRRRDSTRKVEGPNKRSQHLRIPKPQQQQGTLPISNPIDSQRYLVYVPDSQGVILNNPIVPSANAQEPCADVEPTSGRWSDTHQEMSEAAVDQQNVN